jgi:hypothetical protein
VWLLIMALETIHGVLRNRFLRPAVGDFHARQTGAVIVSFLFLVTLILAPWLAARIRGVPAAGSDRGPRLLPRSRYTEISPPL